jgi:hypothetical protein
VQYTTADMQSLFQPPITHSSDSLGDNVLDDKNSGKRGCGLRRPTSHCACPLNVCLASGNYLRDRSLGSPLAFCFLDAEGSAP